MLQHRNACDLCYKRKRKCNGNSLNTCELCRKKGALCTFSEAGRRGPKPKSAIKFKSPSECDQQSLNLYQKRPLYDESGPRISKISRLSPSPSCGLLGLEENSFLHVALIYAKCVPIISLEIIQRSIYMLFESSTFREKHSKESDGSSCFNKNPVEFSSFWIAIAYGALLQGCTDMERIDSYIKFARQSVQKCFDQATNDVLRLYLVFAKVYSLREDIPMFFKFLGFASTIAKSITGRKQQKLSIFSNEDLDSNMLNSADLDEDIWIVHEALNLLKTFIENCMDAGYMSGSICSYETTGESNFYMTLFEHRDAAMLVLGLPEGNTYQTIISCFCPYIEELPSYEAEYVEEVFQKEGFFDKGKVQQLVRFNIVSSSLTALADPNVNDINSLVNSATKGKSNLLPIIMGLNCRVLQTMHLVCMKNQTLAKSAGMKLNLILDRIIESFGPSFLTCGGFVEHKACSLSAYLKLLVGDEYGCLSKLLLGLSIFKRLPGIARFPAWRQDFGYICGLFICAGMQCEYDSIAERYNNFNLGNGLDKLADYEMASTSWYLDMNIQTQSVYTLLMNRIESNAATIFTYVFVPDVNYTSSSFDSQSIQSFSEMVTDCSSMAESLLNSHSADDFILSDSNDDFIGCLSDGFCENLEKVRKLDSQSLLQ